MANIFNSVRERMVGSSRFPLSHEVKTTFNMAELVPFFCQEVIPGDKWQLQSEVFLRCQPMLAPIMHRVNCYVHYFFVPTRLLYENYEAFFDPKRTSECLLPNLDIQENQLNQALSESDMSSLVKPYYESILRMADYMGLPVEYHLDSKTHPRFSVNALPFYAYALIYNEYYRDQNLEPDLLEIFPHGLPDGWSSDIIGCATDASLNDPKNIFTLINWLGLRNRAWEKDYFTSALPDPQVGEEVHLPLTGNAKVFSKVGPINYILNSDLSGKTPLAVQPNVSNPRVGYLTAGVEILDPFNPLSVNAGQEIGYADMSNVTATTINELRRASRLQEFLERTARGGRRYKEMIASHFGVFSKDARLDRPEFLGGGVQPVTISEVLNHTGDTEDQPFVLGQMGGHGISVGASARTRRRFTEHGYLIGIMSVMPRTAYMDGVPKMFSKLDMYDFYWPEFARVGEQEISNKEVSIWKQTTDTMDGNFGYAPRYSEYKFIPSSVHGEMRSSLDYWHLARHLDADSAKLNADFVHPSPDDLSRIFAVETGADQLIGQIYNKCVAIRKMPKYGIPTL